MTEGAKDYSDDVPEHWSDLTSSERREIVNGARSRIFWRQLWGRAVWLKGAGSVLLTLAVVYTLIGEALAAWITNAKP